MDVHIDPSLQKSATLTVTPNTGLADELLDIKVEGLGPRERVTLRATLRASAVSYRGRLFHSLPHDEADGRGALDLARAPALGGDFTGVEPHAGRPRGSLLQPGAEGRDEKPAQSGGDGPPRAAAAGRVAGPGGASARGQRWFSSPEVRGARLRAGRLRGVFLLPQVREVFSAEGLAWIWEIDLGKLACFAGQFIS